MPNEKKKHKFSFRKLVYNDRYLVTCSVLAAIVIWLLTAMNLSPETTKKITVPVTVDFTDTLAEQLGIAYYGNSDLTVDVTISCKKYLVKDIDENDIKASLQTSNVTSTGYLSVPITVTPLDDTKLTVKSYFPTAAQGYYDVAQEVTKPIELNYINTNFSADGYVVGDVVINQSTAVVKGPRSYIPNVERVVADVDLESDLTESQRVNLQPQALDENGNPVSYVSIDVPDGENFVATIPILKVQDLQPTVSFVSGPENPSDFLKVEYSVNSVQVGALESANLTELNLGNISFNDLNVGKNTFTFDASKISGIKVLDGTEEITVTVTVPDHFSTKTINVFRRDISADLKDYKISVTGISSNEIKVIAESSIIDKIDKSILSYSFEPMDGESEITEQTKECRLIIKAGVQGTSWVLGTYKVKVNVTPITDEN